MKAGIDGQMIHNLAQDILLTFIDDCGKTGSLNYGFLNIGSINVFKSLLEIRKKEKGDN